MSEVQSEEKLECENCESLVNANEPVCSECHEPWSENTKQHVSVTVTVPSIGGHILGYKCLLL